MRTQVLLLFGGESSEHDVSLAGAANVFAALDNQKYDTHLVYIDRSGKWWLVPEVGPHHSNCPQLVPVLGTGKLVTIPEGTVVHPDVILPVLHGSGGEDGSVQGLAKLLHVPVVGPSILGASVTMDKDATKRLLKQAGIPVVDWLVWCVDDEPLAYADAKSQLGSSVFVKPASAGSSVGVSRVTKESEFKPALQAAANYDSKVIIEPAIDGREIEVAVLGNYQPSVSSPGEVRSGSGFYDYDAKYAADSESEVLVPADLEEPVAKRMRDLARQAYEATDGRGMARVDFLLDESGEAYVNEINSIPGFTNISMYPKLWRERGLGYSALIDKLIELAIE